ncbi:hypothetical protein [Halarchaeum sp. P4]|uniref:hypothetical protein n=1 Tax=Halarchaeum sp. P4 TaxID=3421639 RepID=UPI003EB80017
MGSRLLTALAGLLVSLVVSAVIYYYTGWLFGFLVVPFVPLLFRRRGDESERGGGVDRAGPPEPEARVRRTCPECGYATTDPEVRYCPRDGTELG